LGYFGAIQKMMSKTNILLYDYVIISNVDVIISPDFFSKLANYPLSPNDGWIAPAIISQNDGCDLNPQATHRYSLTKLKILHFFYQHPTVNWLYEHTLHLSKRHQHHQPGQVYAGHGSFIVLTHEYFVRCGIIDYPIFLYGEEIYIGEQCLRNKLTVNYFPSLQVNDIGNVSTGKMKRSFYYKCNADAIKYIIDNYYKE
jgi:GT2 family glycosyltransferase